MQGESRPIILATNEQRELGERKAKQLTKRMGGYRYPPIVPTRDIRASVCSLAAVSGRHRSITAIVEANQTIPHTACRLAV